MSEEEEPSPERRDRKLIAPVARSSPSSLGLRRRVLPDDLLREASRRLGVVSLLGAGLWTVGGLANVVLGERPWSPNALVHNLFSAGSVLVSLAMFAYSRTSRREPTFILDLGLAYMVVMSLALGNMFHWSPMPMDATVAPVISWIGVLVLMFAAIIPSTPGKTLVAGLFAVSMNPVGMLIARARGHWDFGPTSNVLVMHFPDYMLVGIAVVVSRVFTRLGQHVTRARELGSYRLGELLGRGGMGEVYRATHRLLARPAAVKLIRPEMLGDRNDEAIRHAVARFRREADAAASLRSPHTVELYDFGVADDGTLYFVMELLDGLDLEELVRLGGPLPAARAIFVLRQVCESLEEAHARGLVHRDIKPANIHVGRLGLRHDFVKVLDFGLVKSVAAEGTAVSLETGTGFLAGTPAYIAPESVVGGAVDARTDLYALGCVASFALTGELVFAARTPMEMMAKHLHDAPVAPSQRSELPVPPALDQVILACLAKRPEDRPQSAAELERLLAAIAVEPWGEEEARRWWEANRLAPGG